MGTFHNKFFKGDILSADQFTKGDIEQVIRMASEMEKIVALHGKIDILKGKVMTALFYEPSSRTYSSFVTAIQRLGGGFVPIHGTTNSSVSKGETLADTARTFAKHADVIVMRHPEKGAAKIAAHFSDKPIINAGDGIGEHPTQALLDMYTIYKRHKTFNNLTITFVGDIKNGRTVHSLSLLLSRFIPITINYVAPKELHPSTELVNKLRSKGVHVSIHEDINPTLKNSDVFYITRVQKERFADLDLYEKLKHKYIITPAVLKRIKKTAIILHPLPRVGEITPEVDDDSRAVYMKEQMENGVYVRMALLCLVLKKEDVTSYFSDGLFLSLSKSSVHTDPVQTYKFIHGEIQKENNYHIAKSLGTETFYATTAHLRLAEMKKMYFSMLFPHLLPEAKSALMVSERGFLLKHGESGRTSSHIYLNHRIPLFNDIWDKRLLVRLFELMIHEDILPPGSIYGMVSIPASSSPELTAALHEASPHSTTRISVLSSSTLRREKGAHSVMYGIPDVHMPWIFIDDVFTSGRTFKESKDLLFKLTTKREAPTETFAVTLVNRNPDTKSKFEEKSGMKLFSLTTLNELLEYHWKHFSPLQKKLITSERNI